MGKLGLEGKGECKIQTALRMDQCSHPPDDIK